MKKICCVLWFLSCVLAACGEDAQHVADTYPIHLHELSATPECYTDDPSATVLDPRLENNPLMQGELRMRMQRKDDILRILAGFLGDVIRSPHETHWNTLSTGDDPTRRFDLTAKPLEKTDSSSTFLVTITHVLPDPTDLSGETTMTTIETGYGMSNETTTSLDFGVSSYRWSDLTVERRFIEPVVVFDEEDSASWEIGITTYLRGCDPSISDGVSFASNNAPLRCWYTDGAEAPCDDVRVWP